MNDKEIYKRLVAVGWRETYEGVFLNKYYRFKVATAARNADWRSDLFLVERIALEPDGQDGHRASGGRCRLARNWIPEEQDLTPIQYRYKLPPISDAE